MLGFGDDGASDPRWSGGSGALRCRVNDDGGSSIAEDGMVIVAEGYVWRNDGDMGGAVGRHD